MDDHAFQHSAAVITVLFAAIFRVLPDVQLPWRELWASASFTAALFSIGRFLFAIYLAHAAVASVFGAAGSLAALLVWVYYSCAILFLGVEFTRCSLASRGLSVRPKPAAVLIPPRSNGPGGTA
jgi:membrane protein